MYNIKMLVAAITASMTLMTPVNAMANCQQDRTELPITIERVEIPIELSSPVGASVEPMEDDLSIEEARADLNFYMEIDKPCGLTKEAFVSIMENLPYDYVGFYERNAEFIWEMEQKYNVNAIFICGIIAIESEWGQYDACRNNYSGLTGSGSNGYAVFETEEEGIEETFLYVINNCISYDFTTIPSIAYPYTRVKVTTWDSQVYSAMQMILFY